MEKPSCFQDLFGCDYAAAVVMNTEDTAEGAAVEMQPLGLDVDPEGIRAHVGTMHDTEHRGEQYIIEHAIEHIDELMAQIDVDADDPRPFSTEKAEERKSIFTAIERLSQSLSEDTVLLDLESANTDSIEDVRRSSVCTSPNETPWSLPSP